MNKLTILNETFVILNTAVEENIIIDFFEFKLMINKIINSDSTYIEHCPVKLKKEIYFLKCIMDKFSDKNLLLTELTKFINAFSSIYEYEQCNNADSTIELDKLYYKSVINYYYILAILTNTYESSFNNFKNEFYQIGILIGKYYKDNNNIVKDIIYAKLQELFIRYNFKYDFPTCCAK